GPGRTVAAGGHGQAGGDDGNGNDERQFVHECSPFILVRTSRKHKMRNKGVSRKERKGNLDSKSHFWF
ncbi:MAG: hypothetical protein ACM3MD_08780, partial [Betaproteobacteria bacterium]